MSLVKSHATTLQKQIKSNTGHTGNTFSFLVADWAILVSSLTKKSFGDCGFWMLINAEEWVYELNLEIFCALQSLFECWEPAVQAWHPRCRRALRFYVLLSKPSHRLFDFSFLAWPQPNLPWKYAEVNIWRRQTVYRNLPVTEQFQSIPIVLLGCRTQPFHCSPVLGFTDFAIIGEAVYSNCNNGREFSTSNNLHFLVCSYTNNHSI